MDLGHWGESELHASNPRQRTGRGVDSWPAQFLFARRGGVAAQTALLRYRARGCLRGRIALRKGSAGGRMTMTLALFFQATRLRNAEPLVGSSPIWQTNHAPVLLPGDGRFARCFSLDRKLCPVRNEIELLNANVISSNARFTEASRKSIDAARCRDAQVIVHCK